MARRRVGPANGRTHTLIDSGVATAISFQTRLHLIVYCLGQQHRPHSTPLSQQPHAF